MQTITALAIDSREGLTLLESAVEEINIPIKIIPLKNLTDASTFLNLTREVPEVMIVSSGIILQEGEGKLGLIIRDERFSGMKLFILNEFEGEELHLCRSVEATFIAMPNGYDEMAAVVSRIYEGALSNAEERKKKSGQIV